MEISSRTPIVKFMKIWPAFASLSEERRNQFVEYGRYLERKGFDAPLAIGDYHSEKEFNEDYGEGIPEKDGEMLFFAFWMCVRSDPAQTQWHDSMPKKFEPQWHDFPSSMATQAGKSKCALKKV